MSAVSEAPPPPVPGEPLASRAAVSGASITVLTDPDDSPACIDELSAHHDLERGVVVCLPHPGAGARRQLGVDLLIALGKPPGGPAAEGWSGRASELAGLWLRAERVADLVVLRAERLPPDRWADLTGK